MPTSQMPSSNIPPIAYWSGAICIILILLFGIASCRRNAPAPLPVGVQAVSGTLTRADLSLSRRGTHILVVAGKPTYYVESSVVSLHALEGKDVELQGTFEANTDPESFPVLVVTKVLKGGKEEMRAWTVPALNISFEVPRSWQGVIESGVATFTASGSFAPILRISRTASADLPFDFSTLSGSSSTLQITPLTVGDKKAVKVTDTTMHTIGLYVDTGADSSGSSARQVLTLLFAPMVGMTESQQQAIAADIIKTLKFTQASSRRPVTSASGSATSDGSSVPSQAGKPCGGPAGILCPSGYFCQVTDRESDIGVCKKL